MKTTFSIHIDEGTTFKILVEQLQELLPKYAEYMASDVALKSKVVHKYLDNFTGKVNNIRIQTKEYDPTQTKARNKKSAENESEKVLKQLEEEAIVEGLPAGKKYVKF